MIEFERNSSWTESQVLRSVDESTATNRSSALRSSGKMRLSESVVRIGEGTLVGGSI